MTIEKALQLKKGDKVHYPEDMGRPGGIAEVVQDPNPSSSSRTINDIEFIWVNLGQFG